VRLDRGGDSGASGLLYSLSYSAFIFILVGPSRDLNLDLAVKLKA
jgi:hypothetical protein